MITYNEAFDINHTIYRILLLLNNLKFDSVEYERLRIWDFFMAFPYEIENIRFGVKPEDRDIKKLFPKRDNPYRKITNPRKLFSRMHSYQLTAVSKLAAYGIIANDFDSVGRIRVIDRAKLSEILETRYSELEDRESNVLKILTTYFYHMEFYGESGLKARTKLSEYHYDE
ncbi:ABC-three component system middle component 5 [Maribacter halichondriae]|uniref:ABC-three component system middle component 5 n=1 Tax=Maribacter halichondriae TaxID=2980554 RepID=UPI00235A2879|nr:ABC-three component system middle component 5 [Maribacter sp. Hal144]